MGVLVGAPVGEPPCDSTVTAIVSPACIDPLNGAVALPSVVVKVPAGVGVPSRTYQSSKTLSEGIVTIPSETSTALPRVSDQWTVAVPPPATFSVAESASDWRWICAKAVLEAEGPVVLGREERSHTADDEEDDEGCRKREPASPRHRPSRRRRLRRSSRLAFTADLIEDLRAQVGWRCYRCDGTSEEGGGFQVGAGVVGPLRVGGYRLGEELLVVSGERMEGMSSGQLEELLSIHVLTPNRSLRRARPSRIRVLTVPSGAPVSTAISLWLYPPK